MIWTWAFKQIFDLVVYMFVKTRLKVDSSGLWEINMAHVKRENESSEVLEKELRWDTMGDILIVSQQVKMVQAKFLKITLKWSDHATETFKW